nr:hypothetical protein [Marinicella sp. W31]MDC2878314.1 hypothetical protein [Marinicella sp. W31]
MAGRKKATKPETEENTKADTKAEDTQSPDASDGSSSDEKSLHTEAEKSSVAPDDQEEPVTGTETDASADISAGNASDDADAAEASESQQGSSSDSSGSQDISNQAAVNEPPAVSTSANFRRFVVFKPVRFNGNRIPRGGRVIVTRAGHDELAGMGAISSVWEHGEPVEAE